MFVETRNERSTKGESVPMPSPKKSAVTFLDVAAVSEEIQWKILEWRNSEFVRSQMLRQHPISREEHRAWLAGQRSGAGETRCRVAHVDDKPFGIVSLHHLDMRAGNSDWGMYIGEKEFLGRGLGKVLLAEILRWGFEEMNLQRLYTSVLATNEQALDLYLQAGFSQEGRWREHVLCETGERRDLLWIGMLRGEWEAEKHRILQWALFR
jgi:UDP-4-amino-4,6-dideoxy-N-acetyl-beta-L-altrosamine N-acetyltransferase